MQLYEIYLRISAINYPRNVFFKKFEINFSPCQRKILREDF